MGDHDQTVLTGGHAHVEDMHANIHDDGRTLRPAGYYDAEIDHQYDDEDRIHSIHQVMPGPRLRITQVFRYSSDKLISDALHLHIRPFTVTKWESIYSTVFGSGTHSNDWVCPSCDPGLAPSFTPVIDESYRVVGHLGWIPGTEICVPKNTVAWDSPVAHIFEERRLGEDRRRLLSLHDRDPLPPFPARHWAPEPDTKLWASIRRGELKDASEEQRHQNNINYFLAGGGEALVGRDYVHDQMASQNFEPLLHGGYRCLALVRPDGYLQSVLRIEEIPYESRQAKGLRIIFEVIDIALTIWMIIDIVTISVVLFRAGVVVARAVAIRAVEVAIEREAKASLELAIKIAQAEAKGVVLRGAMAGPKEAAEKTAFWAAARAAPKQFTKDEVKRLAETIAKRMKELGIPDRNIGVKVTKSKVGKPKKIIGKPSKLPGETGEAFNPSGTERGSNLRTFVEDGEVHEGASA
jgi:hypothetical protein